MIDREWLQKVYIAYSVYQENLENKTDIRKFVLWLYEIYGIIPPQDLDKKR